MRSCNNTQTALVLRVSPSGESFLKLDLLSPEEGILTCLKRVPKKKAAKTTPDLFDTASLQLETARQGNTRFVGEYELVCRRNAIGASYSALRNASDFCALLIRNATHMADSEELFQLTERTLDAFASGRPASVVFLKAVYLLLKHEGYPVLESWRPQLPPALRSPADHLLHTPAASPMKPELEDACSRTTDHLCQWLSRETDLVLPKNIASVQKDRSKDA
ncbi:MAG: hypothetical protein ACLFUF_06590 [Opitutales bacterium]